MTDAEWQEAVLDKVERLVGTQRRVDLAAEWAEHDQRDWVEVTFLGPYSSGKSSVLRRLVVDAGLEVPEWLTVSARRETFELNAIDVESLTFTDAPGFAAGNELHDELARDALALSDAFLVVVPPQLLTTNRELVGSILSGRYFFGEARGGVDRATIAVIAQADAMGVDPEDDLDGMRELARRKQSELVQQLEGTAGMPLPGLRVVCVAADPYEEQARQAHPQRSSFDPHRDWDGIDELVGALSMLPEQKDALRRDASVRYFCRVGADVLNEAAAVIDEERAAAEDMRTRQVSWAQHKARVDALVDAARADLETALLTLTGQLTEELGGDEAESRAQIGTRMAAALERWQERWDRELDVVLNEAGMEVDERLSRPRAKRTNDFFRSISAGPSAIDAPEPNSRVVRLLNDVRGDLQKIARQSFELCTGESLEKVLQDAEQAGDALSKGKKVAKTTKAAVALDTGLQIAEGVITIVTIVDAERRQHELDRERRRQREEARDRVERAAVVAGSEIVDGTAGEPGWRSWADTALHALHQQLGLPEDDTAVDGLAQKVTEHEQLVAEFRELLANAPGG